MSTAAKGLAAPKRRAGVDTSLILDEPRKRRRRAGSEEVSRLSRAAARVGEVAGLWDHGSMAQGQRVWSAAPSHSSQSTALTSHASDPPTQIASGAARPGLSPNVRARTAEEFAEVRANGMILYDKLVAQTDPADPDRPLHLVFDELPSQELYPEYYRMIKKPISFAEVKAKLDGHSYVCLADVKTDFNQIFVNAKRFNAPGSAIFLDAKRLHKNLKESYAILTGEAPPPEDDDIQVGGPSSSAHPTSAPLSDPNGDASAKRAPALKPWLTKKLNEITNLTEEGTGRVLAEDFEVLPDRKVWADYYKVIHQPMAFENVEGRVSKRFYTTVQQFVDEVNLIFDNAMFFNDESSRIWHDAATLKEHFAEIMRETPPDFGTSSKGVSRRRADAGRRGSSSYPDGGDDGDDGSDYGSQYGSQPPGPQFDLPAAPSDPFAVASHLASASPSLASAGASPLISTGYTPTLSTLPLPDASNPLLDLAALADVSSGITPRYEQSASPVMLNGTSRTASRAPSQDAFYPRLVAKLPSIGEVPLISGFDITSTPSSLPPIHLDNTSIRQHSFSVPFSTERLEFAPIYRYDPSASANGKGKAAASNGHGSGLTGPLPSIIIRAKPASLVFEPVTGIPAEHGVGSGVDPVAAPGVRYALTPRAGLSVVEFVVRPAGTMEGDPSEEVYRCFITK
ncbi:hypothetical protein JCM10207_001375 [Rhodosporidiobolus poonsookiae]